MCSHVTSSDLFDHVTSLFPAKPVTVGWGKKETQFHGSQGKPKAGQLTKKVRTVHSRTALIYACIKVSYNSHSHNNRGYHSCLKQY